MPLARGSLLRQRRVASILPLSLSLTWTLERRGSCVAAEAGLGGVATEDIDSSPARAELAVLLAEELARILDAPL